MMRILVAAIVAVAFCATLALGQAGPKREQKKKPKPDTTAVQPPAQTDEEGKAKEEKPPEKKVESKKTEAKPSEEKKAGEPKSPPPPPPQEVKQPPPPPKKAAPRANETPSPAKGSDHVARALFTTSIAAREPVGSVDTLTTAVDSVYFFTAIVGMDGETITHRWKHGDEVRAEVSIAIGAAHWRAYSKKRLRADWTGVWTVEVVGADGDVLARRSLAYVPE